MILGVPVSGFTVREFIDEILRAAAHPCREHSVFISYLNAHCANLAVENPEYRKILGQADYVYADGQAIVWAASYFGESLPQRVNAGDFIVELLKTGTAALPPVTFGLVGGRPGVAAAAARRWQELVPGLSITSVRDGFEEREHWTCPEGTSAGGSDGLSKNDIPDVLLVGMGSPLQETWAWENRHRIGSRVVWCVGALFEYYGENRRRAPVWMRKIGLEWLVRLVLEPRRLWRRYLIGNLKFCGRIWKARKNGESAITTGEKDKH
jgi:exopolysaccharide biosynthesis WecB/TagA/CpsF family protein